MCCDMFYKTTYMFVSPSLRTDLRSESCILRTIKSKLSANFQNVRTCSAIRIAETIARATTTEYTYYRTILKNEPARVKHCSIHFAAVYRFIDISLVYSLSLEMSPPHEFLLSFRNGCIPL